MSDHDDDEFPSMPTPPGGMHSPGAAARLEQAISAEAWQTHVLGRRMTPRRYCEATDLYVRRGPGFSSRFGRARRIETKLTAKGDRGFDAGDVAHIVSLTDDPGQRPGAEVKAWCGAYVLKRQRWSGLKAFATCQACRARSEAAVHGDQTGWLNKLGERDPIAARRVVFGD